MPRAPDGDGPERTCIATRQALPVEALIRFVAAPDGAVAPDLRRRLPGRGVWVTASAEAVAEAVRRKAFARALKTKATAPADLPELVDSLLEREALQALSLANKAGSVICGAAKIEGGARRGFACVLHARDASDGGVEKLDRAVRSASRSGLGAPTLRLFSGEQLSLSLGREHVVHAALVAGGPAENFLGKARAIERYRRKLSAPAPHPEPTVPGCADAFVSTRDSEPDE